jgi:hypothetical protein
MKKILFLSFLFYLFSYSFCMTLQEIELIKNDINLSDKNLKSEIINKLNLLKLEINEKLNNNNFCIKSVSICYENINNIKECSKDFVFSMKPKNEINLNETSINFKSKLTSEKNKCEQLKNQFKKNSQIIEENSNVLNDIINYLKDEISLNKNNQQEETQQMISFIQTKKNEISNDDFDKEDENEDSIFVQLTKIVSEIFSFLDNNKNNTNFLKNYFIKNINFNEVKNKFNNKLNELNNYNEKIKYLEISLRKLIDLQSEYEDKQINLYKIFKNETIQCDSKINELNQDQISFNLLKEDNNKLDKIMKENNKDLEKEYEKLCKIHKKKFNICKRLENYCDSIKKQYEKELKQVNDLFYYFDD